MLAHMATLGFPVTTERDFRHYVYQASEFGQRIETEHGSYTYWPIGNGIELWVQANRHRRIIGMRPHFFGSARMRVGLIARIPRYQQSILDGAFYSYAEPREDQPDSGYFPFVCDVPDYDQHEMLLLPTVETVQVTAFADELKGYESEETFMQMQAGKLHLGPESFIASGLYTKDGRVKENAAARAIFSARVRDTEMIANPVTGERFYWARVGVLGGEFDVVADPQVVQGKVVCKGIVRGSFWLSGRIL